MNQRINPQAVAIAQRSFELVKPNVDAFSRSFYARLFEIDPALEILFPTDLEPQRSKLVAMLDRMVAHLSDWDTLLAETQALGARRRELQATISRSADRLRQRADEARQRALELEEAGHKAPGDEVNVQTPRGKKTYEIIELSTLHDRLPAEGPSRD